MRHLRLIPVLFICLFLTGGHYGMLQCVAWAGMLWSYSEEGGLLQGAQDTFSGDKPCSLCKVLAEAKQGEPDSPEPLLSFSLGKLKDLQCPAMSRLKSPLGVDLPIVPHVEPERIRGSWRDAPLGPPPRLVA